MTRSYSYCPIYLTHKHTIYFMRNENTIQIKFNRVVRTSLQYITDPILTGHNFSKGFRWRVLWIRNCCQILGEKAHFCTSFGISYLLHFSKSKSKSKAFENVLSTIELLTLNWVWEVEYDKKVWVNSSSFPKISTKWSSTYHFFQYYVNR